MILFQRKISNKNSALDGWTHTTRNFVWSTSTRHPVLPLLRQKYFWLTQHMTRVLCSQVWWIWLHCYITDQLALTNNFFHLLWSVVTRAAFNMVYLCSSSNNLCLIRWNMYPRLYSTLQASLTWSSFVFCSWFAYSFLLSSICCLLMFEFILCFSTSALERLRSASALL